MKSAEIGEQLKQRWNLARVETMRGIFSFPMIDRRTTEGEKPYAYEVSCGG